jgi:outer membrane protein TolC
MHGARKIWPWLALAACLAVAGQALSEAIADRPPAQMTLPAALAYAESHSPALGTARSQVQEGEAGTDVPRSRWIPTAGATVQLYGATVNNTTALGLPGGDGLDLPRIGGRAYDPTLGFDSAAAWQPYASSLAAVGIQQQIFDFGLTAAKTASADAALLANRHDLTRRRLDIDLGVTVAFMAVQAAHQIETAATSAVVRSQAHRDQAAAMVNGELRSRIYLARAQAELARLQVGALRAASGVAVAESALAEVVGFDQPRLDAQGTAPTPAPLTPLTRATQLALDHDPGLKAIEARIQAQREEARATADLSHPTIFATGSVSVRSGGATTPGLAAPSLDGFLPQTPNWDVGVVANWSFLDPVDAAKSRAEREHARVLEGQLAEARQAVVSAAQDAWVRSDAAAQTIPRLEEALAAARQNYDQANVRFNQGLGTSVEIADAETLLTDAEVQLAEGQFDLQRSRAQLERVMAGGI